jgi:ComF family protein
MKQVFKAFLNLFLTRSCTLCGRSADHDFCRDCQRQLQDCRLPQPALFWQPPLPIFAWGAYQDSLKRAISALKYQNHSHIGQSLGQWMGLLWRKSSVAQQLSNSRPIVIPIPLHADRLRQRGFNQATLLAQGFCDVTRFPLADQGLLRVKATTAQFGLSVPAREDNLSQAFAVGKALKPGLPRSILLLDDIYTTGSTARSALQVLTAQGHRVQGIVVLAKAMTKTQQP